jgi:hypothetical protein
VLPNYIYKYIYLESKRFWRSCITLQLWVYRRCSSSGILNKQTFRKLELEIFTWSEFVLLSSCIILSDKIHRSNNLNKQKKGTNFGALVRERIVAAERPPLVGEVNANFCGCSLLRGQHNGSLRPYSRLSGPEPLLFLASSSSGVLTTRSGPCSRPTNYQKIW